MNDLSFALGAIYGAICVAMYYTSGTASPTDISSQDYLVETVYSAKKNCSVHQGGHGSDFKENVTHCIVR